MSSLSEAKLAANRANAQLSTGPTTEAGKAKVSLNAVKSGLTGRTVLLPSDDVAAYEATVARHTARWQPQGEEECVLVQALADNDWRTQRIPALEYGIYALGEREFSNQSNDETDPDVRRTLIQTKVFFAYAKQLLNLQSQEARLRRHRIQDEARLETLQNARKNKEIERTIRENRAPSAPAIPNPPSNTCGFEFPNSEVNQHGTRPGNTGRQIDASDPAAHRKNAA